jgi:hypothetical protein
MFGRQSNEHSALQHARQRCFCSMYGCQSNEHFAMQHARTSLQQLEDARQEASAKRCVKTGVSHVLSKTVLQKNYKRFIFNSGEIF